MRILFFAHNYAPEQTGGAAVATGRALYLAGAGHDVTVITGFPHFPEWRVRRGYRGRITMRETMGNVSVLRRWHHVPRRQTALGRALMEASFAITATPTGVVQRRPDVVLSVTPSAGAALAGTITAKRFGVPHGVFVLDLAARTAQQSGMRGGAIARWLAEPLERAILRSATRIGIITEGFKGPMREMGVSADRVQLMTDWKETAEPTLAPAEVRERYGFSADQRIVLHAGNMGFKQGLEAVVDAASAASTTAPDIHFLLVGDGNQRPAVQNRARDLGLSNVTFLPLQPKELFPSLLGAADVLLLHQRASVVETSIPSKLADYFASGRPVLAVANPASEAAREVARAGGGVVVSPDEPQQLVDEITELLDNPTLSATLGSAGQAYAREHYSFANLSRALDEFLAELLDSRAS